MFLHCNFLNIGLFSRLTLNDVGLIYKGIANRKKINLKIIEVRARWPEALSVEMMGRPGYSLVHVITQNGKFDCGYKFNKQQNEEIINTILKRAPHLAKNTKISSKQKGEKKQKGENE